MIVHHEQRFSGGGAEVVYRAAEVQERHRGAEVQPGGAAEVQSRHRAGTEVQQRSRGAQAQR